MKSLCKSIFALAALALVSTTAAQAQTVVRISGSTAYRAACINAIANALTGATASYIGGSLAGANDCAFQGTIGATTYQVECHFGGSITGIVGLTVPASNEYTFMQYDSTRATTVTAGGQSNFFSPYGLLPSAGGGFADGNETGTQTEAQFIAAYNLANPSTPIPSEVAQSTAGFSDAFQATAAQIPGATSTVNAVTLNPVGASEKVGILPFAFLKGAAQTTDGDYTDGTYNRITTITLNAAWNLFSANSMPAELLTNNTADSEGFVYAVGRDQDSGTRVAAFSESGLGVGHTSEQYNVTTSGGVGNGPDAKVANLVLFSNPTFPTIGGGYGSGSSVATGLETSGWDNSSLPGGNYGYGIGYLGAADTDTAITAGFEITSPVTFDGSTTTYTAHGTTGVNVSESIAAGDNVYLVSTTAASQAIPATPFTTVSSNTGTAVTLSAAPSAGTYTVLIDCLPATYVRPQFLMVNGVALNQKNINQGTYQFWEYEHFFLAAGQSTNSLLTTIYNDLTGGGTDAKVAGYELTSMGSANNGGAGTTQKSAEGKPIHY